MLKIRYREKEKGRISPNFQVAYSGQPTEKCPKRWHEDKVIFIKVISIKVIIRLKLETFLYTRIYAKKGEQIK